MENGEETAQSETPKRIVVDLHDDVPQVDLPEGWLAFAHQSGGIIYLHKETRVVTWSRPYQIGKSASTRKHDPPVIAIPCLHQRLLKTDKSNGNPPLKRKRCLTPTDERASKTKKTKLVGDELNSSQSTSSDEMSDMTEASEEPTGYKNVLKEFETISSEELHCYLKNKFDFKELSLDEWKTPLFSDKTFKTSQTFNTKKKQALKTEGKTPVQILNEYLQKEIKDGTVSFTKITIDGLLDFCAEAVISGMKYGIGIGENFKSAKHDASAKTLSIINPAMFCKETNELYQRFDDVDITDNKVITMIEETISEDNPLLMPYQILLDLLRRNFKDFDEEEFGHFYVNCGDYVEYTISYKDIEYTGIVSDIEEGEDCDNKVVYAKHHAAQYVIKSLYPALHSWGSVIRMSKQKLPKAKVKKESSRTNRSMLNALRDEMRKISTKDTDS